MKSWRTGEALVGVMMVGILAIMIAPLSPTMLDTFLAMSIAASLLTLMVGMSVTKPLEFSVFPTLLLLLTLFRLGLNVASTRLILMNGFSGTAAAGRVVGAFGNFVVGGNVVVGLVVFIVLVVINFVVITKGAGRIAEVSARFILDALPGKQMSIDSEIASGSLTEEEARTRRREVEQEADFFGAMDGASKFVRGDAIAGLIITAVNILGGLVVGMVQHNMGITEAMSRFTILTVGDGLVSQIPALLISTAAGAVVTRASTGDALAPSLGKQLLGDSTRVRTAAMGALAVGILPGMPLFLFGLIAGGLVLAQRSVAKASDGKKQLEQKPKKASETPLEELLDMDRLQLEVGYALVPLVDAERGGEVLSRLHTVRRQIAKELGLLLPPVHVRDDLSLGPNNYRIMLSGQNLAESQLRVGQMLAMSAGDDNDLKRVPGKDTVEPAFGLAARWIAKDQVPLAEQCGLTVVDPATVLTTHFSELVRKHSAELLGRQDVYELIEHSRPKFPKLVEDLVPGLMSIGEVHAVLRELLVEGVSIRDLQSIFEALAEVAQRSPQTGERVEAVRRRLGRQICAPLVSDGNELWAAFLDRGAELKLRDSLIAVDGEAALAPDVEFAKQLLADMEELVQLYEQSGKVPVLVVAADLRRPLRDFLQRFGGEIRVLTHRELPVRVELRAMGLVGAPEPPANALHASTPGAAEVRA